MSILPDSIWEHSGEIIDSHIHVYDPGLDFWYPPKSQRNGPMGEPHMPKEFFEVARPAGVAKAIVVEAVANAIEDEWTLDVVESDDRLIGYVANIDLRSTSFAPLLEKRSRSSMLVGVRPRFKPAAELSDPLVQERIGLLDQKSLSLELALNLYTAADIKLVAARFPELRIIIDHMGSMSVSEGSDLKKVMTKFDGLETYPNIYCKLSAYLTLSRSEPAPLELAFYEALFDNLLLVFGPKRLLWGSNWPPDKLKGSYSDMVRLAVEYCDSEPMLQREDFLRNNALRAFGIE